MGLWKRFNEWWHPKRDLREICREKYGDDFAEMYDMVNAGIPIGNLEETKAFLALVEAAKEEA